MAQNRLITFPQRKEQFQLDKNHRGIQRSFNRQFYPKLAVDLPPPSPMDFLTQNFLLGHRAFLHKVLFCERPMILHFANKIFDLLRFPFSQMIYLSRILKVMT